MMIVIHFRGWKELRFIDIKDCGPTEDIFDTIVKNDYLNTNLEKIALLAKDLLNFLERITLFLRILKKGNRSSKMINSMNLYFYFFQAT